MKSPPKNPSGTGTSPTSVKSCKLSPIACLEGCPVSTTSSLTSLRELLRAQCALSCSLLGVGRACRIVASSAGPMLIDWR